MVGDMVSTCPLHISKVLCVGVALTSHFAVPKGVSVWLATLVRCLWHPLCKRPNGIFFANCLCLLPLASSLQTALWHPLCKLPLSAASDVETKQSKHARAAAA